MIDIRGLHLDSLFRQQDGEQENAIPLSESL
jgi:hypothetical protein